MIVILIKNNMDFPFKLEVKEINTNKSYLSNMMKIPSLIKNRNLCLYAGLDRFSTI